MKQLTCEMCGGTDLLKQDGVFVCQTCGCKYSVEEARKMMGEVSSTPVEVKNAAQLENLLNLAKSSFESQNYEQAESFCNQVIAMDDKNYENVDQFFLHAKVNEEPISTQYVNVNYIEMLD